MKVILANDWFCPGGYRIRKNKDRAEPITMPDEYFSHLPKSATVVEGPDPHNPAVMPVMNPVNAAREKMFGADPYRQRALAEEKILNEERARVEALDPKAKEKAEAEAREKAEADAKEQAEFQEWKVMKAAQTANEAPETETGEAETGETETSETKTGEAETSETETSETETGEAETSETETGETETGETETGEAETGEAETTGEKVKEAKRRVRKTPAKQK